MKAPRRIRSAGLTLMSVLISIVVFCVGLLALGAMYARFTTASSQNEIIIQLAPWSNEFWGVVQANPSLVTSMAGTYTSSTISSAPTALQNWLNQVLNTSTSQSALPNGQVVITTGVDAASGSTCTAVTSTGGGCSVTVTYSWSQNSTTTGAFSATRSQTFYYQFPP